MSGADELRTAIKDRLEAVIKEKASQVWEDLNELWKVEVREALEDLGQLTVRLLRNEDVAEEVLHAEARVLNWTFVGADLVRDALRQGLEQLVELFGALVRGFLKS
jgi:hypothetical protein